MLPRRFLQLASKPHSPRSFLLRSASLDSNSDAVPQDTTIPSASDDPSNVEGVFEGEILNSIAEVGGEPQREDSIANDDDQQVTRLRILRDRMWIRETLNDVTTAELIANLESPQTSPTLRTKILSSSTSQSVDFTSLLSKLERRQYEMCRQGDGCVANSLFNDMGSIVCSAEELMELGGRMERARDALNERIEREEVKGEEGGEESTRRTLPEELDPTVYLREDGTVDWDGALQGGEAAKKFGAAVWSRINGRDPNELEGEEKKEKGAVVKIKETEELKNMREDLDIMSNDIKELDRSYNRLLNSGVDPTSSVGRVELSRLPLDKRNEILKFGEKLKIEKDKLSVKKINYELERIYVYLNSEVEASVTGVIPLNDRLAVAEFGLLESQMININSVDVDILDADVLKVVVDQVVDFKRRLGIDYYVQGINFNVDTIKVWFNEVVETGRDGLFFYWKGVKLLVSDLRYSFNLITKAVTGVVLKPREVRTLRRTFRDFVTFIPFIIILIIPLTPIGHVFVFGAIQRFFPDFFPSCFTERRQNLLQLFEQSEFQDLEVDEGFLEKILRIFTSVIAIVKVKAVDTFKLVGIAGTKDNSSKQIDEE
ncbi:hypothetical protein TL16_g00870 [Triparma laevis f. inornata]|uniref:Letm1 RBD domain-containing protein n=1 Tax=Triparma laevis f. inornata TaxID=1714386 RepID=A0A9W7DPS2_9STRA|nr:hypothetical protein TL16_g00870 [Triparma laevis f. inornata]